jgi:hypothetical protein
MLHPVVRAKMICRSIYCSLPLWYQIHLPPDPFSIFHNPMRFRKRFGGHSIKRGGRRNPWRCYRWGSGLGRRRCIRGGSRRRLLHYSKYAKPATLSSTCHITHDPEHVFNFIKEHKICLQFNVWGEI